jgi:hypothetical protein
MPQNSRKRLRRASAKCVRFEEGTIFYERLGAYIPPVAKRNVAEVNQEESDECDDDDWLEKCAGVGAAIRR